MNQAEFLTWSQIELVSSNEKPSFQLALEKLLRQFGGNDLHPGRNSGHVPVVCDGIGFFRRQLFRAFFMSFFGGSKNFRHHHTVF